MKYKHLKPDKNKLICIKLYAHELIAWTEFTAVAQVIEYNISSGQPYEVNDDGYIVNNNLSIKPLIYEPMVFEDHNAYGAWDGKEYGVGLHGTVFTAD